MSGKVSVIIPSFNGEKYIIQTLQSVFDQSYQNIEIIVVDDGSTDSTLETINPYMDRIRLIQQPNSGVSAARNSGIAAARGDYIMFLDADDLLHSEAIERRMQILLSEKSNIVVGGVVAFSGETPSPEDKLYSFKLDTENLFYCALKGFSPQGCLIEKVVFNQVGLFDPFIKGGEDTDFFIRASLKAKISYDPHASVYYRQHFASASNKFGMMLTDRKKIFKKNSIYAQNKALYWWYCQLSLINLLGYLAMQASTNTSSNQSFSKSALKLLINQPTTFAHVLLLLVKKTLGNFKKR